jgi:hypothetical protein
MIVKRDGRVEPFNRAKMVTSMRNAGATSREANLVTTRVSTRLVPRSTVPSREVSSMVARSLSHVNPAASRNYAYVRDQRLAYTNRASRLSAEMAAIDQQVNSLILRLEGVEGHIQGLAGRIARLRQGNFRAMAHLEPAHVALAGEWARVSPQLRTTANLRGDLVRTRVHDLQQALTYRLGLSDYNLSSLLEVEAGLPELRSTLADLRSSVAVTLSPIEQQYAALDHDVTRAEATLSLLEGASFPWEAGETPILAIRAKDLQRDLDGVLALTNRRFIFEQEREVVVKKTLFVVTEKKTVREVAVQKPIGMVTALTEGKVGFFKGGGLFVAFAAEAGIPEMKFDTTDQDAAWATKTYRFILSGQADRELVAAAPTAEPRAPQLVVCPVCGAPYKRKIYRGETSVQCEYCGATVSVQV